MMKKRIIISAILIIIAAAAILFAAVPRKADIKGVITSVRTLSVSEDRDNYVLNVDGTEFGFEESVYILITENTQIRNTDGKAFLAESFIAGDVVEVYYVKSTKNDNVITADKVIFEYHVKE